MIGIYKNKNDRRRAEAITIATDSLKLLALDANPNRLPNKIQILLIRAMH